MLAQSLTTANTTQQPTDSLRAVRSTPENNTQASQTTDPQERALYRTRHQQEQAFYKELESVAVLSNN